MHILLSSSSTPQYKQDVLRCLAAPLHGTVQFRYDKGIVADDVLAAVRARKPQEPLGEAIVCFVDTTADGPFPVLPVRLVTIESATEHGTTLSLLLRMKGVVEGNAGAFTDQLGQLSGGRNPRRNVGEDRTGTFFFRLSAAPTGVTISETLSGWERVVTKLQQTGAYADEDFFWTIIGVEDPSRPIEGGEHMLAWADDLKPSVSRNLLIYHYRPQGENVEPTTLTVTPGGAVAAGSPEGIRIDSGYDLKRWQFSTGPRDWNKRYGWLRIQKGEGWSLDLPANVPGSKWWVTLTVLLAGLFISLPNILGVIQQHAGELDPTFTGPPHWWFIIKMVTALVSGPLAVLVVLVGVPRMRP